MEKRSPCTLDSELSTLHPLKLVLGAKRYRLIIELGALVERHNCPAPTIRRSYFIKYTKICCHFDEIFVTSFIESCQLSKWELSVNSVMKISSNDDVSVQYTKSSNTELWLFLSLNKLFSKQLRCRWLHWCSCYPAVMPRIYIPGNADLDCP